MQIGYSSTAPNVQDTAIFCSVIVCTVENNVHPRAGLCMLLYCACFYCTVQCTCLYCTVRFWKYCFMSLSELNWIERYSTVQYTCLHCTFHACSVQYMLAQYCLFLHCTVRVCIVLYMLAVYCTCLHCKCLHCTVRACSVLYMLALYWTRLHCTVLYTLALHALYNVHCTCFHCTVHTWTGL